MLRTHNEILKRNQAQLIPIEQKISAEFDAIIDKFLTLKRHYPSELERFVNKKKYQGFRDLLKKNSVRYVVNSSVGRKSYIGNIQLIRANDKVIYEYDPSINKKMQSKKQSSKPSDTDDVQIIDVIAPAKPTRSEHHAGVRVVSTVDPSNIVFQPIDVDSLDNNINEKSFIADRTNFSRTSLYGDLHIPQSLVPISHTAPTQPINSDNLVPQTEGTIRCNEVAPIDENKVLFDKIKNKLDDFAFIVKRYNETEHQYHLTITDFIKSDYQKFISSLNDAGVLCVEEDDGHNTKNVKLVNNSNGQTIRKYNIYQKIFGTKSPDGETVETFNRPTKKPFIADTNFSFTQTDQQGSETLTPYPTSISLLFSNSSFYPETVVQPVDQNDNDTWQNSYENPYGSGDGHSAQHNFYSREQPINTYSNEFAAENFAAQQYETFSNFDFMAQTTNTECINQFDADQYLDSNNNSYFDLEGYNSPLPSQTFIPPEEKSPLRQYSLFYHPEDHQNFSGGGPYVQPFQQPPGNKQ